MRATRLWGSLLALGLASGCVGPSDSPDQVYDLRVLGVQFEPPEISAPVCANDPRVALAFSRKVRMRVLIADPAGDGRDLKYSISLCSNTGDYRCDDENDTLLVEEGTTREGVLETTIVPGVQVLPDAVPLLAEVTEQDTYKGLGGIRVPVVVRLEAEDGQVVYAQKLMVYSCPLIAGMTPNRTPQLPGILLDGQEWAEGQVRTLSGSNKARIEPMDFQALQEPYVVPNFKLEPVSLVEAWKVSYHTTFGRLSPDTTGGVDFTGGDERHVSEWSAPKDFPEPWDATFYFVVRDGRGGMSWLVRQARWFPE